MKLPIFAALIIGLSTLTAAPASADPGKDESGKGRWREGYGRYGHPGDWDRPRDRKVKVRTADGCEIERKWKKGEYEEKIKCKPNRYGYRH
jgi:hypothetical protein